MMAATLAAARDTIIDAVPLARIGTPADVGESSFAIIFLTEADFFFQVELASSSVVEQVRTSMVLRSRSMVERSVPENSDRLKWICSSVTPFRAFATRAGVDQEYLP